MPSPQPCPNCRREGLWLEYASAQAWVNYYRCATGHVWNIPKNAPAGPIWFVTEVPTPTSGDAADKVKVGRGDFPVARQVASHDRTAMPEVRQY